ncbi:MAG: hypothetical protein WBA25_05635 [Jannaschia sp.]
MSTARVAAALAGLVLLAALAYVLLVPRGPLTLHVSGDGAGPLRATFAKVPEAPPGVARVEVVLLRRMENLRHVPEAQAMCAGRCDAAATVFVHLDPGRVRKTLIVDLGRLGGGDALDTGAPLPPAIQACLADLVAAELASLTAQPPACLPGHGLRWLLPYGL